MVNIIGRSIPVQPQQSGVGSLFETLAAPFMDLNSGEMKRSATSLNAAKTAEIQRALDAGQVLADLARSGNLNSRDADAAGILAGKPSTFAGGYVKSDTLRSGAPLQGDAVARSSLAAGDNYGSTGLAFAQNQANELEKQRMQEATRMRVAESALEPVMTPDGPRYVRRPDAVNQQPLLSTDQVRAGEVQRILPNVDPQRREAFALGNPQNPEVVNAITENGSRPAILTPTGFVDAQTRQPITEKILSVGKLTATSAEGLQAPNTALNAAVARRTNTEVAAAAIDDITQKLSQPDAAAALGPLGNAATLFNNARSQVEAIVKEFSPGGVSAELSNPGVTEALQGAQTRIFSNPTLVQRAQELSITSGMLQSQIIDLAYMMAKARDPRGQMSNQDVERAERAVGAALLDPRAAAAVMGEVKRSLIRSHNIAERNGSAVFKYPPQFIPGEGAPGAPAPGAPAPGGAPQPAAPAPTVSADPIERARDAIARGASREQVIQRLRANGINPEGQL